MPFDLIARNTVVRGEFNRAIIGPKWVASQGILPLGEVEVLISDSPDMPRAFRLGGFQWTVGHDRLVLASRGEVDADTGATVAEVLRKLHHTPVTAVGHNFVFESHDLNPALDLHVGDRAAREVADQIGHELRSSTCEVVVAPTETSSMTLKIGRTGQTQRFDLNFNFVVQDANAAVQSAERSPSCRERADEILLAVTGAA